MRVIEYKTVTCELLEEFVESVLYALRTFEMLEGMGKELAEMESSYILCEVLSKHFKKKRED